MDKIFKVQFFNIGTDEIFALPTLYTDRVEACVCGQNYCRDRQHEDGTELFFRVVVVDNEQESYQQAHPICNCDEDDCDGECECCGLCCEDEEDSEEPDFSDFEELVNLIYGN